MLQAPGEQDLQKCSHLSVTERLEQHIMMEAGALGSDVQRYLNT